MRPQVITAITACYTFGLCVFVCVGVFQLCAILLLLLQLKLVICETRPDSQYHNHSGYPLFVVVVVHNTSASKI